MANEFHRELSRYVKQNNENGANRVIMRELGKILVRRKQDFADLLTFSGIPSDDSESDLTLVDKFIDNVYQNRTLMIGAAFLANQHNKMMGADGEEEISNEGVRSAIKVMYRYFDMDVYPDNSPDDDDDFYDADGEGGAMAAAAKKGAGGLATAVAESAKLGQKVFDYQRQKKFGATDALQKQVEARNQMVQSILEQRQRQSEANKVKEEQKAKNLRTGLIVGGAILVGIGIVVAVIYLKKNKGK